MCIYHILDVYAFILQQEVKTNDSVNKLNGKSGNRRHQTDHTFSTHVEYMYIIILN